MKNYENLNISLDVWQKSFKNIENLNISLDVWQKSSKNINFPKNVNVSLDQDQKRETVDICWKPYNCHCFLTKMLIVDIQVCPKRYYLLCFSLIWNSSPDLGIHPRICPKWAICSGSGPPQHAPEVRMTWVLTNSLKL